MRFSKARGGGWAIELRTGTIGRADFAASPKLVVRNRDYHPLVLCDQPEAVAVERLGIEAMRWQDFLLNEPRPI